ncbi:SPOR domain-containing protein [Orbaceae bacterium ESL0727]|nr:SPOR domain-containing protein [Orbaceae bacterium ESL0727]
MRVDKDDRYVSEPPKKSPEPLLKIDILHGLSKSKLIIAALTVVIILLLLSLVIFRTSRKNEITPLTPPAVSEAQAVDEQNQPDSLGNLAESASGNANNNTAPTSDMTPNNGAANGTSQNVSSMSNAQSSSPAPISRVPSETPYQRSQVQERLNIPDDNVEDINSNVKQPTVTPPPTKLKNSVTTLSPTAPKAVSTPTTAPKTTHSTNPTVTHHQNNAATGKIADSHFAIQLSASSSEKNLKAFAIHNHIPDYQIYETKRDNKPWFVLIQGNYASSHEAKTALKSLPSSLQTSSPWVKSGAAINKEKTK